MTARALMVLGTGSHVGKSLTVAALCRLFVRAGYRVAPFKAQNMSLNSAATTDGLEIGRAQALQAEAAGIPSSVHMNPVLIKPGGDRTAQIIVRGKVWQNLDARTYFGDRSITLLPIVQESYRMLADANDVVVLEGAGSPAEINLKNTDIVNMRMAKLAGAPCVLVGDIDRGGVFASLLGTLELLDEEERRSIRGFLINKFRGDRSLLMPGVHAMERRLGIPCVGVVPWLDQLDLDEEDSAGFAVNIGLSWQAARESDALRIAVVAFPSIANFTDFAPLASEPSVALCYVRDSESLASAHIIVLPGSKQTVQDLRWLRERGFEQSLLSHVSNGGLLVGICGGLQMLGKEILDPHEVESGGNEPGLNLLPLRTTLAPEKFTMPVRGELCSSRIFGVDIDPCEVHGYEIHMGQTEYLPEAAPFANIRREMSRDEIRDGCISMDRHVLGTYLHGVFDDDGFRHVFLSAARTALHLPPAGRFFGWRKHRERQLDRLADTFASAIDLDSIFGLLNLPAAAACAEEAR
ncbi:MAG TPA: cobyric acid synthase [Terracidiphilus sp.]|nr:cobyric acid synthase [Terracidiphilus sp.]